MSVKRSNEKRWGFLFTCLTTRGPFWSSTINGHQQFCKRHWDACLQAKRSIRRLVRWRYQLYYQWKRVAEQHLQKESAGLNRKTDLEVYQVETPTTNCATPRRWDVLSMLSARVLQIEDWPIKSDNYILTWDFRPYNIEEVMLSNQMYGLILIIKWYFASLGSFVLLVKIKIGPRTVFKDTDESNCHHPHFKTSFKKTKLQLFRCNFTEIVLKLENQETIDSSDENSELLIRNLLAVEAATIRLWCPQQVRKPNDYSGHC